METNILTAQELAAYLHVKPVTVYKMAKQGRVPAFRVAKSWRFHKPTIDQWLDERSKYDHRVKEKV